MSGADFEKEFGLLFSRREETSESAPSSVCSRNWCRLRRSGKKPSRRSSARGVTRGYWPNISTIRPFSGRTARMWRSRTRKVIWLEPNYESEQVLKIGELARSRWRKMFADLIVPDHFAEAIAKIQFAPEP